METMVGRSSNVLTQLSREHRRLHADLERLVPAELVAEPNRATAVAARLLRHEALEEVLVYAHLDVDQESARLRADRRDEQRLLVRQATQLIEAAREGVEARVAALRTELIGTFVSHVDREEIEGFVRVRRNTDRAELRRLGDLQRKVDAHLEPADLIDAIGLDDEERRSPLEQIEAAAQLVRAIIERETLDT